jgi:hypothetical protein
LFLFPFGAVQARQQGTDENRFHARAAALPFVSRLAHERLRAFDGTRRIRQATARSVIACLATVFFTLYHIFQVIYTIALRGCQVLVRSKKKKFRVSSAAPSLENSWQKIRSAVSFPALLDEREIALNARAA